MNEQDQPNAEIDDALYDADGTPGTRGIPRWAT
jgi:hypothetical protein